MLKSFQQNLNVNLPISLIVFGFNFHVLHADVCNIEISLRVSIIAVLGSFELFKVVKLIF